MLFACRCHIIPIDVLEKLSKDKSIDAANRKAFADTAKLDAVLRKLRSAQTRSMAPVMSMATEAAIAAAPSIQVYDCKNGTSLPGVPVPNAAQSTDTTLKRIATVTDDVAKFYQAVFNRNSIDGGGMTLLSSGHYGVNYNNAFWTGGQMVYGDGDGQIFIDFTNSDDVIGHELTHGVTQYTAGFLYQNESGALNESMSDCFGSMFRQWRAKQDVTKADWLIGAGIMGALAKRNGKTCLRDMANPAGAHALSPQPAHWSDFVPGGGVHTNSGIPNKAFHLAAMALGGKSWEVAGQVWYAALTSGRTTRQMRFKAFARLTVATAKAKFAAKPAVTRAVEKAWRDVGVLP